MTSSSLAGMSKADVRTLNSASGQSCLGEAGYPGLGLGSSVSIRGWMRAPRQRGRSSKKRAKYETRTREPQEEKSSERPGNEGRGREPGEGNATALRGKGGPAKPRGQRDTYLDQQLI